MVLAAIKQFSGGQATQAPLPFLDTVPALTVVKSPRIKAQPSPAAFFWGADGIQPVALKYRDGEFHSSFGAWSAPGYSNRDLSANEDGYARAYTACVWAYRAINVLVQKVADVLRHGNVVNKQTSNPVDAHPLMTAFDLAFRMYQQDVFENWLLSKQLYGEAYVELVHAFPINPQSAGIPRGVRVLNALGIEPVIQRGAVVQYRYNGDDDSTTFTPFEIAFDKYTNPLDDARGLSPLAAALDSVNVDRTIVLFTRSHIKNNARPGLIFTPKEGRLSQADVDLIQTTLSEDVKGAANAGNPLLMPTAFDVTVAAAPPMDDLNSLTDEHKRRICSAIGVPVALVDYTDMAFQLSPEQNKTFYELTVIPNAEKIARVINTQIMPFFDTSRQTEFRVNVDNIRAGLADPRVRTEIANLRLQAGGITLNEYREQLDLEPVSDGDVRFLPMGVQIVKSGELGQSPAPMLQTPSTPLLGAGNGNAANAQPPAAQAVDVPPIRAITEEEKKELRNWKIKAATDASVDFIAFYLPAEIKAYIRLALDDGESVNDVFTVAREMLTGNVVGRKAYADTRAAFVAEMVRIIGEGQKNVVSRAKFGGSMRSALRRFGLVAFRDGMNSEQYDPESFSAAELAAFRAWQADVSQYITGLGDELFKQAGITPDQVELRANMWADKSLREIFYKGAYFGAPNRLKKWVRDPAKDSCVTCVDRDGEIRAYSAWEQAGLPGSSVLACHGFFCGCHLLNADGSKSVDPLWILNPPAHECGGGCDHDH